jgi:DNA-cytosine methyltransferase
MLKYVEFCCGIGGTRAGLDAAGWQCQLAIDNNQDAIDVHKLVHGEALYANIEEVTTDTIPNVDVWVAGFPCQPFSTSGSKKGFEHHSGNVFEHLIRLIKTKGPSIIVLENVEGLLTNKSGHTFAVILSRLTELDYRVDWIVEDLQWFGVPQSRPRLFIIAEKDNVLKKTPLRSPETHLPFPSFQQPLSIFSKLLSEKKLSWVDRSTGSLNETERKLAPAIGKKKYKGKKIFGSLGSAADDTFFSYDVTKSKINNFKFTLAEVVAPRFKNPKQIRSGRFYARGGPTKLFLREELVSHCVGTSLGGAPLFAVPLSSIKGPDDRARFLEFANWHREQDGVLVMRLRPDRSVLLFGEHTKKLHSGLSKWGVGDTRKYVLVGNMVAPIMATGIANLIDEQIIK